MIDPGDVKQILRNKRIANSIFGAGIGSGIGYLVGQNTGLYDPWMGTLTGGLIGAGFGFGTTRKAYEPMDTYRTHNRLHVSNQGDVNVLLGRGNVGFVNDGYWFAPSIGGAALGLASSSSVTDNPYAIAASGAAGFLGGRALDNYMLSHTKFPTFR